MELDASRLFCRFLSFSSLSIHISHDTKGPIQMTNCLTDRATDHGMDGRTGNHALAARPAIGPATDDGAEGAWTSIAGVSGFLWILRRGGVKVVC